ncbi:L-rhamnose mutarotase [Paracoccus isoporae]|uniref:L-rhamnose mutarotase n=1 Tax=Paracoccus isoporae TaxID=591205 RepID=A0A1G6SMY7_9RHOB|nr:L-rhamnose mutarotase [Paracoccus isoporae]SDD18198.1 L-rhamnose mutarotase [Paracoccus isoporae]
MIRMGSVIALNPDKIARYKELHANAWPGVLKTITECNIRNYVIYLREPENLLFSHFEYHGTDWAADQAKMAADPVTQEWWSVCEPCQKPLATAAEGEWWAPMEEVFFHE